MRVTELLSVPNACQGRNTKADTRTGGAPGAAAPEPGSAPISVNIMSMGGDDRLDVLQPGALSLSDMATYHIRTEDDLAEGPGDGEATLLTHQPKPTSPAPPASELLHLAFTLQATLPSSYAYLPYTITIHWPDLASCLLAC